MPVETIYLCPYTHADWAWNFYRPWHAKRYIRAFEAALDLMDQNPEFTWFIDTWADQFRPVVENRPDLVERMRERVAEKRFGLAAGHYANPHPDRCGREAYIRNTLYGQRHFLEVFPAAEFTAASHIDCIFGHSQLPQLLTKMGFVQYFGCRSQAALDARGVPRQFRWRGLDGSAIACERAHYGEGWDLGQVDLGDWPRAREVFAREVASAERRGTSPIISLRIGGGDDALPLGDPSQPVPLFDYVAAWRRHESVAVEFATPEAFARALAARTDLPEWAGPLDCVGWSYWHASNGRDSLALWRRRAEIALLQAESACLHAEGPYPGPLLDALWADLLSVSSHATLWLWEPDYEEFLDRVKEVFRSAQETRDDARREMVEAISPATDGRPIVVFNPLPFGRDELCRFYYAFDEAGAAGLSLVEGHEQPVPCQFAQDGMYDFGRTPDGPGGRLLRECRVTARVRVPASGFTTLYLRRDDSASPASRFELAPKQVSAGPLLAKTSNGLLEAVSLDGLGTLIERLDIFFEEIEESNSNARLDRSATLTGSGGPPATDLPDKGFGDHSMHYGPVIGRQFLHVEQWSLMESGPLGARLFCRGSLAGNQAELEAFLCADRPRIDCELRLYVTQPRSGFVLASVKLAPFVVRASARTSPIRPEGRTPYEEIRAEARTPNEEIRPEGRTTNEEMLHVDIPFGVEPRVPVGEPYGMHIIERGEFPSFWGLSWADVTDVTRGVALFSEPGQQGFRWREGRLEHFLLKTIAPDNLRGKRWTTKSRTGLGYQDFRFAVFLHPGDWRAARLYREVERYRQPLDAQDPLCRLEGEEPDTRAGLALGPENVMLSAFFQDDAETMLRLYENEGQGTTARVQLPFAPSAVEITDLLGRAAADPRRVSLEGGSLSFEIGPWEIVTLRLRSEMPDEHDEEPPEPPPPKRWEL